MQKVVVLDTAEDNVWDMRYVWHGPCIGTDIWFVGCSVMFDSLNTVNVIYLWGFGFVFSMTVYLCDSWWLAINDVMEGCFLAEEYIYLQMLFRNSYFWVAQTWIHRSRPNIDFLIISRAIIFGFFEKVTYFYCFSVDSGENNRVLWFYDNMMFQSVSRYGYCRFLQG